MGILWALIVGLVVGALAKLVTPGPNPHGILVTSLLGIAGSLLASFLGHAVGWYEYGQAPGIIASVIGAVIVLAIYHIILRSGHWGRRATV